MCTRVLYQGTEDVVLTARVWIGMMICVATW